MTSEEYVGKFQLVMCHNLDLMVMPLIGCATREICINLFKALARSEK